jgi:hypothetical protein
MASHSASVFHPYIKALSAPILSAIGDRYYKVTAEALRVCGELVRVLRPNLEASAVDFRPYIGPIYNAILGRLANQDQDQVWQNSPSFSVSSVFVVHHHPLMQILCSPRRLKSAPYHA